MIRHGAALALALALTGAPLAVGAEPATAELVARGFDAAYNLDYDEAIGWLTKAVARAPDDADAHRALAVAAWLRIGFLRGSITVDDYLGSISQPNVNMTPPPPEEARRFHTHIARARELAEAEVQRRPRDPDALFRLGTIVGVQASYGATVEGRVLASFRAARQAYDAHERVLALDPRRQDAALIVGTYRYIVSALSMPVRWLAYVAGFGGGRERGVAMVEAAARHPGATQVDARFTLFLLYNREGQYERALPVIRDLQRRFPRNRQLWYEAGATLIRAGRFAEAAAELDEGIRRRDADRRERMFGEDALWRYKRGVARSRLGQTGLARADFDAVLAGEARDWVRGRAHAERGRLAEAAGDPARARREYRQAMDLATRGNDPIGHAEAAGWLARLPR